MDTGAANGGGTLDAVKNPAVRRFLKMVARPDLRAEFPEQYEKRWENKGFSGKVQIIRCKIADHPCELVFSLFFNADEVIQTGIVIKYQGEALLNEVRKGDALDFKTTRRIDPVAFLKAAYPWTNTGTPPDSVSFTLAVDDDSEAEVWRAVRQLTGKSDPELQLIWGELIASNAQRMGKDQVSPIIKTWLKKERDRIDLEYLRFAQVLLPRSQDVVHFAVPGHTCAVVTKHMRGTQIRELIDAVEPEWWGGMFFGLNQGQLVRIAHEQKDRLLALKNFASAYEFPVEEIFIDNRHLYSVLFVGQEALVWRTRHQAAAEFSMTMPTVAAAPDKGDGFLSRLKRKPPPPPPVPETDESPANEAPAMNPYKMVRAEKAYMEALRKKSGELKTLRKEYLQLLYDSDPRRFQNAPEELRAEIQGAIEKALGKDAAGIQKEAALIEAHVTIFFEEL
jgi:hypothetical protein